MNLKLIPSILCFLMCLAIGLQAAPSKATRADIAGLQGLNLVQTAHYNVYYKGRNPARILKTIETVWSEAATLMPRIDLIAVTNDVEVSLERDDKGKLILPKKSSLVPPKKPKAGPKGEESTDAAETFRMNIIILDDQDDFFVAAKSMLHPELPPDILKQAEAGIRSATTYVSNDSLTRVHWNKYPDSKAGEFEIFISHGTAFDLMTLNQGESSAPFWLEAGLGYYTEFKLFNKSFVAYLDFEEYYKNNSLEERDFKVTSTETLAIGQPWAPILKRILKKGKIPDPDKIFTARPANLTPELSGYMYSMLAFLVSDSAKCANFIDFLDKLRTDKPEDVGELLLQTYGYKDKAGFQKAWQTFILSPSFK